MFLELTVERLWVLRRLWIFKEIVYFKDWNFIVFEFVNTVGLLKLYMILMWNFGGENKKGRIVAY